MAPTTFEEAVDLLQQTAERSETLARENKILREEIAILKRGLFGRSSERLEPGQLRIFEDGEIDFEQVIEADPAPSPKGPKAKKGHGRGNFPEHLPREVIDLDVPEDERVCPTCGAEMRGFGEDSCERGHIVPARFVVRRYVKKKYACPNGHCVKTAQTPPSLIDRCKYEPSMYAHVVTSSDQKENRLSGL